MEQVVVLFRDGGKRHENAVADSLHPSLALTRCDNIVIQDQPLVLQPVPG